MVIDCSRVEATAQPASAVWSGPHLILVCLALREMFWFGQGICVVGLPGVCFLLVSSFLSPSLFVVRLGGLVPPPLRGAGLLGRLSVSFVSLSLSLSVVCPLVFLSAVKPLTRPLVSPSLSLSFSCVRVFGVPC